MHSIRENGNTMLSIGIILNRATVIIQKTIPLFQKMHPDVNIRVVEMPDTDLSSVLRSEPIDLLICYQLNSATTSFVPLYEEQYYLCISNSLLENRFSCEERDAILSAPSAQISDFVRCPFLSTRYTDFLTSIFKKCCEDNNAVPQITVETSSVMTRLSLCASGLGVMFLSKSLYQQATSIFQQEILDAIRFIPLSYQPEPIYRQLGINYLTQRGLTPVEQSFIDTAKKALTSDPP